MTDLKDRRIFCYEALGAVCEEDLSGNGGGR